MEEVTNLTQDDVLDLIGDFPILPYRNKIIISVNVDEPDGDLILSEISFAEVQYVLAVGSHVDTNLIKPGCKVILDLDRMTEFTRVDENTHEKIGRIKIKPIEINGRVFAMINDSYVDAIDNR